MSRRRDRQLASLRGVLETPRERQAAGYTAATNVIGIKPRPAAKRHLYFAYGSNLDKRQMVARCPGAKVVGRVTLDGWRLVFRGVADVERKDGQRVVGGLWSITDRDLVALDRYEGWPFLYDRRRVDVVDDEGRTHRAIVYVMNDRSQQTLPSRGYADTVLRGHRDFGINPVQITNACRRAARFLTRRGITRVREVGKRTVPADHELCSACGRWRLIEELDAGGICVECMDELFDDDVEPDAVPTNREERRMADAEQARQDQPQTELDRKMAEVDEQYRRRVRRAVERAGVEDFLELPRKDRDKLTEWHKGEARKVRGLDPRTGEPTPELRREQARERREHRAELENGETA